MDDSAKAVTGEELRIAASAAQTAARRFAERGQTVEAAVSRLMADRYIQQLTDKEK